MTATRTTDTVAAFVRWRGMLLLLRRSDAVRSFRGLWHGVSGTIEAGVLEQALVEIEEETGLARADLAPRARGLPFAVPDERPGHIWRVHPILLDWTGAGEPALRLNWENDEARWVPPGDVAALPLVPGLVEAVARVAEPAHMEAVLVADREHGAGELTERLLDVVAALPPAAAAAAAARVAGAFPMMASLAHVARATTAAAAAGEGDGGEADLRDRVDVLRAERAAGLRAVVARAVSALAGARVVATLSHSGTVLDVAAALPGRDWLVAESLPGGEGARTGRILEARSGAAEGPRRVRVVADADLVAAAGPGGDRPRGLPAPDAVLLGADAVLPDGSVINKIGSRALAEAAGAAGRLVVVAADPWKRLPAGAAADTASPLFEVVPAAAIGLLA